MRETSEREREGRNKRTALNSPRPAKSTLYKLVQLSTTRSENLDSDIIADACKSSFCWWSELYALFATPEQKITICQRL